MEEEEEEGRGRVCSKKKKERLDLESANLRRGRSADCASAFVSERDSDSKLDGPQVISREARYYN